MAQLAAVIESTDDAIISFSLDGRVSSWNPGAERLYGEPAEEVLGRGVSRVIPVGDDGAIGERLDALAAGETVGELETRYTRRDGTTIDIAARISPMVDHLGRVVGASAVVRDITEQRARERALRASEELLDRAQSIAHVGGWIAHLDGAETLVWTRETYRIFGLPAGVPLTLSDFRARVHPDDLAAVDAARSRALASEDGLFEVDHRIVRPDGTVRWVREAADVTWGESGEPITLTGVIQDVTERREAEQAIRESERRFRLLAENARDLIFLYRVSPDPAFEFASPAAMEVTGYTPAELFASPQILERILARDTFIELRARIIARSFEGSWDVEIRRGDGARGWVNLRLTPIHDDAGQLVAIEGIARDITEHRRVELHRQNLARRLLHVQEEERAAIANDVHDEPLQTITAISIQLQVLERRIADPALAPLITTIRSSLATSIEQLRGLLFELHPPALELGGLVESLREFLRRYDGIERPVVELHDRLATRLSADEAVALFRIAREGLANAYKHAKAGRIRLEVGEFEDGLLLVVDDDGVGFHPEREQPAGHLGLASIRERAERVGGHLEIRSTEGEGTTLTVFIPRLTS